MLPAGSQDDRADKSGETTADGKEVERVAGDGARTASPSRKKKGNKPVLHVMSPQLQLLNAALAELEKEEALIMQEIQQNTLQHAHEVGISTDIITLCPPHPTSSTTTLAAANEGTGRRDGETLSKTSQTGNENSLSASTTAAATKTIEIPVVSMGVICGKNMRTVKQLSSTHSCHIAIPPRHSLSHAEDATALVTLSGTQASIRACEQALNRLVERHLKSLAKKDHNLPSTLTNAANGLPVGSTAAKARPLATAASEDAHGQNAPKKPIVIVRSRLAEQSSWSESQILRTTVAKTTGQRESSPAFDAGCRDAHVLDHVPDGRYGRLLGRRQRLQHQAPTTSRNDNGGNSHSWDREDIAIEVLFHVFVDSSNILAGAKDVHPDRKKAEEGLEGEKEEEKEDEGENVDLQSRAVSSGSTHSRTTRIDRSCTSAEGVPNTTPPPPQHTSTSPSPISPAQHISLSSSVTAVASKRTRKKKKATAATPVLATQPLLPLHQKPHASHEATVRWGSLLDLLLSTVAVPSRRERHCLEFAEHVSGMRVTGQHVALKETFATCELIGTMLPRRAEAEARSRGFVVRSYSQQGETLIDDKLHAQILQVLLTDAILELHGADSASSIVKQHETGTAKDARGSGRSRAASTSPEAFRYQQNVLCLVTGDGNSNTVTADNSQLQPDTANTSFIKCAELALQLGWEVEVFCWSSNASRKWWRLQKEHPAKVAVVLLDDFKGDVLRF